MKLAIEESVLRQALEALGNARQRIQYMLNNGEWYSPEQVVDQADEAITALRTALDAAKKVEPSKYSDIVSDGGFDPRDRAAPTPPTNTDSELRQAARAVVDSWFNNHGGVEPEEIDRLRKAL